MKRMAPLRALIFLLVVLTVMFLFASPTVEEQLPTTPAACAGDICYALEIARSAIEQRRGLSGRDTLAEDAGMLFIVDPPVPIAIWMKNMRFPLDVLWLDADGRVNHFETHRSPCTAQACPTFTPPGPASFVLELNAGEIDRRGIEIGTRFEIKL